MTHLCRAELLYLRQVQVLVLVPIVNHYIITNYFIDCIQIHDMSIYKYTFSFEMQQQQASLDLGY